MANSNQMPLAQAKSEDVNLADYLATIFEYRWLILVIAATITACGLLYTLLAAPVYRSDVVIQVEDSDSSSKNLLLSEVTASVSGQPAANAEMELVRSRTVVGEAVTQLNLGVNLEPKYFPVFGRWYATRERDPETKGVAAPLFGLSSYAWGGEEIELGAFQVPENAYRQNFSIVITGPTSYVLRSSNDEQILQGQVGEFAEGNIRGGKVSLQILKLQARAGTEFEISRTSELSSIIAMQNRLNVEEVGKQSGIISVQLDGTDPAQTARILNTLAREYVRLNIAQKSAEAEKTLVFLEQQFPTMKKEVEQAEERYNQFRIERGTVNLSEEGQAYLRQSIDDANKVQELEQTRREARQRFTAEHPTIKAIDAQIAAARAVEVNAQGRIGKLPALEQSALRLMRDMKVSTDLYTNLLNNAQQLRVLKAGQTGNVRVVDRARTAESPVKPKKALVVGASILMGLFLGLISAFVRKSLLAGLSSSEDVERATGIPVYASIPHSPIQARLNHAVARRVQGQHVLGLQYPDDVTVESIRSLRTSLQFAMLEAKNNIVMITGPSPGVGKSFISANLAVVLAASGKRVLLIDGDMRRGYVNDIFGLKREPGVSEVVSGMTTADKVIQSVVTGLDFVATGTVPPNPSELLVNHRFAEMLEQFSANYDVVLIDTPPVLAVTDSAIVGKHAGTTLLGLKHGKHPVGEVLETARRLKQAGVEVRGILFNDIPKLKGSSGGYSYAYEYGSRKT